MEKENKNMQKEDPAILTKRLVTELENVWKQDPDCWNRIHELIQKGAAINATNELTWTALMLAARDGKKDNVQFLLERGANIKVKNYFGWTALNWANYYGHTAVVALLQDAAK